MTGLLQQDMELVAQASINRLLSAHARRVTGEGRALAAFYGAVT